MNGKEMKIDFDLLEELVDDHQMEQSVIGSKGSAGGWIHGQGAWMEGKPQPVQIFPLPPGIYNAYDMMGVPILLDTKLVSDNIIELPDTVNESVVVSIRDFWGARERFKTLKQLFKRGILLKGPPGSGKTVAVLRVSVGLVEAGGVVLIYGGASATAGCLKMLRSLEPERPVIVIIEDIDQIVTREKRSLLALLDGEAQVDNVVYLATTNYVDQLPPELTNRPSRFDEVVEIGYPSAEARRMYLRSLLGVAELPENQLDDWVRITDNLAIAHLKELAVATYCLGRDPLEVVERLRKMGELPIVKASGSGLLRKTAEISGN